MIETLIRQLAQTHGLKPNPPASADLLQFAERSIGTRFPNELARMFRHADGAPEVAGAQMRPMSIAELLELRVATDQMGPLAERWRAVWFLADDQSNHAGVYCSGPLAGMVVLMHHENQLAAPRYWSVERCLQAALDGTIEEALWGGLVADFPIAANPDEGPTESGASALADAVLSESERESDDDAKRPLQMCGLYLLPRTRAGTIISMLEVDDMWVPETAAEILGSARLNEAVPGLLTLARRRKPNGTFAAVRALGSLATPESREALVALADEPGAAQAYPELGPAMLSAGMQARQDAERHWLYRNGQGEWVSVAD